MTLRPSYLSDAVDEFLNTPLLTLIHTPKLIVRYRAIFRAAMALDEAKHKIAKEK